MKRLVLLMCLMSAVAGEVPEDARKLAEIREREINRINLAYVKKLDELLVRFRASGETEKARAIEEMIADVEKSPDQQKKLVPANANEEALLPLVGVWQRDYDGGIWNIPDTKGGTFNGKQRFTMTWEADKNRVLVVGDHWVNYLWFSTNPDVVNGSYEQKGRTVRYKIKRIK